MRNYWSCSSFADWLRGTPKPSAETSKGWRVWNDLAKKSHPIRYWIAEELLDRVQSFVRLPIDTLYGVKYYINNRWVTRTHGLTAHPNDIKPGTWMDVGYRFLPCLFNELVDFVEIELAWWQIAWSNEGKKKYNAPFWASGWFRWRTWRCPEAGMDNLKWQKELVYDDEWIGADDPKYNKPTPQAESAKEIYELYHWWKVVRPARPDVHDASGWTEICNRRRKQFGNSLDVWDDESLEQREEVRRALDLSNKLEEEYEQEDEDMMIRLIKIRRSLWT